MSEIFEKNSIIGLQPRNFVPDSAKPFLIIESGENRLILRGLDIVKRTGSKWFCKLKNWDDIPFFPRTFNQNELFEFILILADEVYVPGKGRLVGEVYSVSGVLTSRY